MVTANPESTNQDMSIVVEVAIETLDKNPGSNNTTLNTNISRSAAQIVNPMQRSLSKSSLGIKNNKQFLKMMSQKYARQVEECENQSPLPIRTSVGGGLRKSSLNFSPGLMPLSQKGQSLVRLPRKG